MNEEDQLAVKALWCYLGNDRLSQYMQLALEEIKGRDCDLGKSAFSSGFLEGFRIARKLEKGQGRTAIDPGEN